MKIHIITDSACDISPEKAREMNVNIIPLTVRFGDQEFRDGIDLNPHDFFEKLIETDVFPQTSQITPYIYQTAFESLLENGAPDDAIICITLSSRLSGCYQSACTAASIMENDNIYVIDSLNATTGQGLLIEQAVRLREQGLSAAQLADHLAADRGNIRLVAMLDTLEYLKKGGRISAAAAMAGTFLSIKPVIELLNGEVSMLGKARGSKKAENMLTTFVEKYGGIDFDMPYSIIYSGLSDQLVRKYIEDSKVLYEGKKTPEELFRHLCCIGPTIGTHIGPGAIGLVFFSK